MLRVLSPDFCLYLVSFVQKEMPTLRNGVFTYTKWVEFLSCKCSWGCTCWLLSGCRQPALGFGPRKCRALLPCGSVTGPRSTPMMAAAEVLYKGGWVAALNLEGGAWRLFGGGICTAVALSPADYVFAVALRPGWRTSDGGDASAKAPLGGAVALSTSKENIFRCQFF